MIIWFSKNLFKVENSYNIFSSISYIVFPENTIKSNSTSDLMYRMIPGFYISILALLSLYCLTKVVRHPHDVRTGELQLRKARKIEKKRKKEAKGCK